MFQSIRRFWSKRTKRIAKSGSRRPATRTKRVQMELETLEDRQLLTVSWQATWLPQGPGPITNGQALEGTAPDNNRVAGAVETIAVNPANSNDVYVGTVNGGIWHTPNFSVPSPLWTPLTDHLPSLAIGSIAFSPLDSTHQTLFAGTGNFSSGFRGGSGIGIVRTTDGGATWAISGRTTFAGLNIDTILPTSVTTPTGQVVLVASDGGLFRSADGAATFSAAPVLSGNVTDLVGDPGNNLRFYAAVAGQGVFRSNNGGATWVSVNTGISGVTTSDRIRLAISSAAGVTAIYAGVIQSSSNMVSGVFRSTNQGASWRLVQNLQQPDQSGQGNLHFAIVADPQNPSVFYVGGDTNSAGPFVGRLFRVTVNDANPATDTWQFIVLGGASGTAPHADSRNLVFAGNDLLLACDGGIYRCSNPASSTRSWISVNGNLQPTEFYSVAYDSRNHVIFGGAQDVGSPGQIGVGNTTWATPSVSLQGDGNTQAVDNTSGSSVLRYSMADNFNFFFRLTFNTANLLTNQAQIRLASAATPGVLFSGLNSTDRGNLQFFVIHPYALNAANPKQMMLGGNGLYEDDQTGSPHLTGDLIKNVTPSDSRGGVSAIAYGGWFREVPHPDVAYVGIGGRLFLRTSAGGSFLQLTAFPGGTPRHIVLDPQNWQIAYVTDGSNVFVTTNAGTNWTNLTGNLSSLTRNIQTLELFTRRANTVVLAGGFGGVFRAELTTLATPPFWVQLGQALPRVLVTDLHYNVVDDVLVAGTFGRGAWTIANATPVLQHPSVLVVRGDEDGVAANDVIAVVLDSSHPGFLEILVNSHIQYDGPFASVSAILINGGSGNDNIFVNDVPAGLSVTVNRDAGPETVLVSPGVLTLDAIAGSLTINGDGLDQVFVFDTNFAGLVPAYTLTNLTLRRTTFLPGPVRSFSYHNLANLVILASNKTSIIDVDSTSTLTTIHGGSSPNLFRIAPQTNTLTGLAALAGFSIPLTLIGSGADGLELFDQANTDPTTAYRVAPGNITRTVIVGTVIGVPINRVINYSGFSVVTLDTTNASTTISVQGNMLTSPVTVHGGIGSNTLDYSAYTTDVSVNLKTAQATGLAGFTGILNVTGGSGNDVLVGGGGNSTLTAGAGRSLLIGGAGTAHLVAGSGDDILIAGTTAYDSAPMSLHNIMTEWTRTDATYQQRIDHLMTGAGLTGGVVLNRTRVFANGHSNTLTGGLGMDWFFALLPPDVIQNKRPGEIVS